jgi:hypothetical protein
MAPATADTVRNSTAPLAPETNGHGCDATTRRSRPMSNTTVRPDDSWLTRSCSYRVEGEHAEAFVVRLRECIERQGLTTRDHAPAWCNPAVIFLTSCRGNGVGSRLADTLRCGHVERVLSVESEHRARILEGAPDGCPAWVDLTPRRTNDLTPEQPRKPLQRAARSSGRKTPPPRLCDVWPRETVASLPAFITGRAVR